MFRTMQTSPIASALCATAQGRGGQCGPRAGECQAESCCPVLVLRGARISFAAAGKGLGVLPVVLPAPLPAARAGAP